MSEKIEDQEVDLIEDISEEQLDNLAEDVEVDEELTESKTKKEAKDEEDEAETEVSDEEGEVEDEDEMDDEDEDEKSESKKEQKESVTPSTKAGMIKAIFDKMSDMSKDDLQIAYEQVMADKEVVAEAEEIEINVDFSEDLNALVEGEESLAEGFKDKAATIFEAAVKQKVSVEVESLNEKFEEKLAEEVETVRSDLVEKVDGYLNYVVEQWMSENEVAITNGLRTEIAENFIESLKSVFVENYVEVPESKADMVDELANQVEELEEQLNKSVADNIELAEKVADYRRDETLREATVGLAETEVEKLRSLAEGIEYESQDSYAKKIETLKESYFKVKPSNIAEEADENNKEDEVSPMMAAYIKALSKK